ncbi:MAG: 30S ribosomal protein S17 [Candidatus Bathyarchaeia archaeon]
MGTAQQIVCDDRDCPFHGSLRVRGRVLEGVVIKARANKMVVVEVEYLHYVPKYMRYERRRSRIHSHNPPCINAKVGDRVKIAECRPISKTVSFVVIEKKEEGSNV